MTPRQSIQASSSFAGLDIRLVPLLKAPSYSVYQSLCRIQRNHVCSQKPPSLLLPQQRRPRHQLEDRHNTFPWLQTPGADSLGLRSERQARSASSSPLGAKREARRPMNQARNTKHAPGSTPRDATLPPPACCGMGGCGCVAARPGYGQISHDVKFATTARMSGMQISPDVRLVRAN
jgi:hypothetical protein